MFRKSVVASAVGLALSAGIATSAQAGVIAQAILDISSFTISASNPEGIGTVAGSNQVNTSLNLNGVNTSDAQNLPFVGNTVVPVSAQSSLGAPGYVPYTPILSPTPPTATFGNASGDLNGNAIADGGANARTDSTVSIVGVGSGSAQSTLGFTSTFTIVLTQASDLTFAFSASPFLRAFVDPLFSAQAGEGFSINIAQGDAILFNWSPNGLSGDIAGGTELADPFTLNNGRGQTLAGETFYAPGTGVFSARTNLFQAGSYEVRLSHFTNASAIAQQAVPEPGSLALLASAVVGAGVFGWRRRTRED
jgi:hypothetical protein